MMYLIACKNTKTNITQYMSTYPDQTPQHQFKDKTTEANWFPTPEKAQSMWKKLLKTEFIKLALTDPDLKFEIQDIMRTPIETLN